MSRDRSLRLLISLLSLFLVLLVLTGCDFSGQVTRTVGGVNITELFAPPTSDEVEAVRSEWDEREIVVEALDVFGERTIELEDGSYEVSLVSHQVGGTRHVGALIVPEGAEGPLAVLVYAHGGDEGISIDDEVVPLIERLGELAQEALIVVPSYRSESLRSGGNTFSSEGEPSPWDWDVDDSLALMQAAIEHIPQADEERIGVLGVSRGALVGQLMAARDDRIDAVVSFFGPTDFYSPWTRGIVENALTGSITPLPGVRDLVDRFVLPLQQEEITMDEVRYEMTRRSIVEYVDQLPAVQLHHGEDDQVVPVSEATRFRMAMEEHGRTSSDDGDFQYYVYPSDPPYPGPLGHHNPDALPDSAERTLSFLNTYVVSPTGSDE